VDAIPAFYLVSDNRSRDISSDARALDSPPRWLILQLERCSAPFPFEQVFVDRDNDSAPGANAADENLMPSWAKTEKSESEVEEPAPDMFQSGEEPQRGLEPLRIGLIEDRFDDLSDKQLMKEEKIVQRYRFSPMKADANQMLTGFGTGQGKWGARNLQLTKLTTVQSSAQKRREVSVLPASPPEGRARWTVRPVAEEAVKRKLVPRVGRETIRILLLSHDLKSWRDKNVGSGRPR
jgi:hypothetical protein